MFNQTLPERGGIKNNIYMNLTEKYQNLLNEAISATSEAEKERILQEIDELVDKNREHFPDVLLSTLQALRPRVMTLRVREAIEPVLPILNMAYIAENHFHKSRAWLSQRLNGAVVGGTVVTFKPTEINILADALRDISKKLEEVANTIHP